MPPRTFPVHQQPPELGPELGDKYAQSPEGSQLMGEHEYNFFNPIYESGSVLALGTGR